MHLVGSEPTAVWLTTVLVTVGALLAAARGDSTAVVLRDARERRPMARMRDTVAGAAFVFLAGLALWPPRAVYWTAVAAVLGDPLTLALVGLLAAGLGAAFVRVTGASLRAFAGGGVAAYAVGMLVIEALIMPDSPVHLVWYGGLLGCFVGGATLHRAHARRSTDVAPD
ncbi:MAG: hypothetical protein ABEJ73_12820 [Haloplanus sp.]